MVEITQVKESSKKEFSESNTFETPEYLNSLIKIACPSNRHITDFLRLKILKIFVRLIERENKGEA